MSCSATSPVPVCPLLPSVVACADWSLWRAGLQGEAAGSGASSRPLAGRGTGTLTGLVRGFPQTLSSGAAAVALPCQMPWHLSMSFVPSLAYASPLIYGCCRAARPQLSCLPRPRPGCVSSPWACGQGGFWGEIQAPLHAAGPPLHLNTCTAFSFTSFQPGCE